MKGQAGIETLLVFGFLIFLLAFAIVSYINRSSDIQSTREYLEANKICYSLKNIINQLASDSFGSSVKFNVPNKLELSDYNLTLYPQNRILVINWKKYSITCSIFTQNVTNSTGGIYTSFIVSKGDRLANNTDGVVFIV